MTCEPVSVAIVQRQLDAYNAHEAAAFASCYAESVEILGAGNEVTVQGRAALLDHYQAQFAERPALQATVVQRIAVGPWVIDHEVVTGAGGPEPLEAIGIFHVEGGLISQVRYLRS